MLSKLSERPASSSICCRFKKAVEKGEIDEQEQKRAHARQSLERYMHYWQRWAENDSSRKKVGSCARTGGCCRVLAAAPLGCGVACTTGSAAALGGERQQAPAASPTRRRLSLR